MAPASSLVPINYKVRSKNPTDVEYWFCQQLMRRIHNVLLNNTSEDALSFFICTFLLAHASQRVPNSNKTLQKSTALYLISKARVGNARRNKH